MMHTQRAQNYLLHFLNDCAHQRLTSENCQLHFVHITQDLQRSHRICTHHTRFAHTTLDLHRSHTISSASNRTRFVHIT